jgi:predicted GNAT superfamily acetyltransferase
MSDWKLKILDRPSEMEAVEGLQRIVWPASETEIVPAHVLIAAIHNGGLLIGAREQPTEEGGRERLVGFVFGFPGFSAAPGGLRPKHYSHMLAVHPDYRDRGLGFALKRAQWQMARHQGLDRITWTFDPLLSRNAYLNIAKLGAVCNTYRREFYGEMRDGLNVGLPSDRFDVDWWLNTKRVERRLSRRARRVLDLAHFLGAGAEIVNPTLEGPDGWPRPAWEAALPEGREPAWSTAPALDGEDPASRRAANLLLAEIPADFLALKAADRELALEWRLHSRALFEDLFARGYLVTDFVFLPGKRPRSFYVLSHGESTLE